MEIEDLPDDALLNVFRFLPAEDLVSISVVCLHWNILSRDESLWRRIHLILKADQSDFAVKFRCLKMAPVLRGLTLSLKRLILELPSIVSTILYQGPRLTTFLRITNSCIPKRDLLKILRHLGGQIVELDLTALHVAEDRDCDFASSSRSKCNTFFNEDFEDGYKMAIRTIISNLPNLKLLSIDSQFLTVLNSENDQDLMLCKLKEKLTSFSLHCPGMESLFAASDFMGMLPQLNTFIFASNTAKFKWNLTQLDRLVVWLFNPFTPVDQVMLQTFHGFYAIRKLTVHLMYTAEHKPQMQVMQIMKCCPNLQSLAVVEKCSADCCRSCPEPDFEEENFFLLYDLFEFNLQKMRRLKVIRLFGCPYFLRPRGDWRDMRVDHPRIRFVVNIRGRPQLVT